MLFEATCNAPAFDAAIWDRPVAHCAAAHSGEGELLVRSLENTILHHIDYAFWGICRAGGLLIPETIPELKVRH